MKPAIPLVRFSADISKAIKSADSHSHPLALHPTPQLTATIPLPSGTNFVAISNTPFLQTSERLRGDRRFKTYR